MKDTEDKQSLESKIRDWFDAEGYPLEFRTVRAFAEAAFEADQGMYVQDRKDEKVREIDVLAGVRCEVSSKSMA
jgi:hypothetical protein